MRNKIPGNHINLLLTTDLIENLEFAQKILSENRSSIIRKAISQYMTSLNISEKFDKTDLNKGSDVNIFKEWNGKETE